MARLLQRIKEALTTGERWTEEDDALAAAVEEAGHNWTPIAVLLPVALLLLKRRAMVLPARICLRETRRMGVIRRRVVKEGG